MAIQLIGYATPKCENGVMVSVGAVAAQGGANDYCYRFRYRQAVADFDQCFLCHFTADVLSRSQLPQ